MTEIDFKEVGHNTAAYWKCVELRDEILRKPLGLAFSKEELMAEFNQIHLAAFKKSELLACLSLLPLEQGNIKMRQVAVAQATQGKGLGKQLVRFSEAIAKQKGFRLMSLHARDAAVPFYKKIGYSKIGVPFIEVGISHSKMTKTL